MALLCMGYVCGRRNGENKNVSGENGADFTFECIMSRVHSQAPQNQTKPIQPSRKSETIKSIRKDEKTAWVSLPPNTTLPACWRTVSCQRWLRVCSAGVTLFRFSKVLSCLVQEKPAGCPFLVLHSTGWDLLLGSSAWRRPIGPSIPGWNERCFSPPGTLFFDASSGFCLFILDRVSLGSAGCLELGR